jgi:hypothetical protein
VAERQSVGVLDAIEHYIADDGRFVYLGGNGLYWNVGCGRRKRSSGDDAGASA